jgi:hypothetical protein
MLVYCILYILALIQIVLSNIEHLILAIYEHPHCTDSDILLFLFLLTNGLIVTLDKSVC